MKCRTCDFYVKVTATFGNAAQLKQSEQYYQCLVDMEEQCLEEERRQAMIRFLQATDPNGCYSDEDCLVEFGEKLDYETAEQYFVWFANSPVFDSLTLSGAIEALDMIKQKGLYAENRLVIDALTKQPERSNEFYRKIWDEGAGTLCRELFG